MDAAAVKALAKLGLNRTIPTCFEQAWLKRTRINPVRGAMTLLMKEKEQNAIKSTSEISFVVTVACFFLWLIFGHWAGVPLATIGIAAVIVCALSFFWFLARLITGEMDSSQEKAFLEDLRTFFGTATDEWGWSAGASEKQLREHALEVLVQEAELVLEAQSREDYKKLEKAQKAIRDEELMEEFGKKYDALRRLGIISGGYDKAFRRAARRRVRATKSRYATSESAGVEVA